MRSVPYEYVGNELKLFEHAKRWKAYWRSRIQSSIHGDVLEVGAGLGSNTVFLQTPDVKSWRCLEPDPALGDILRQTTVLLSHCTITIGTTESLVDEHFDCILYIDVLEHIEDDKAELARAAALLRPAGRLIVLSPAHSFLYNRFDKAIGHYRRYSAGSLRACLPAQCALTSLVYLDSVGMFASLANRALLQQSLPTPKQILTWDRFFVPVSRILDPLLGYRLGKSIVGIWTRQP
jgi:SAM-dependent methyltransferase